MCSSDLDQVKQHNTCIRVSENMIFLFYRNWAHPSLRLLRSNARYVFLECNILIVDPGFEGYSLPDVEGIEWQNARAIYPELYGEVKLRHSKHNGNCSCYSSMLLFHMTALQAGVCLKTESGFKETCRSVLGGQTELGRSHRIYIKSQSEQMEQGPGNFHSLVPPPFLLFLEWEDKVWKVPFADLPPSDSLLKFLSSYGSAGLYMNRISEIYRLRPDKWESEHPLLNQPGRNTELYELTKHLHSSESLYRVSFVLHPLAYHIFKMASTRDEKLRLKTVQVDNPGEIEESLICTHLDFLTAPQNEEHFIHCAECPPIFSASGSVVRIQKFTRAAFVQHFESEHYGSAVLMGVANELGSGSRIYENYVLYLLSKMTEMRLHPESLKKVQEKEIAYDYSASKVFGMKEYETDSPPTWGSGPRAELLRGGNLDSLKTKMSGLTDTELGIPSSSKNTTKKSDKKMNVSTSESDNAEAKRVSSSKNRRSSERGKSAKKNFDSLPTESFETIENIRMALMSDQEVDSFGSQLNSEVEAENESVSALLGI